MDPNPFTLQTACTLTFAVYMLAMHPSVFARLRNEILTQVGSKRRPTYEDIKEMKYLRAVINGRNLRDLYDTNELLSVSL